MGSVLSLSNKGAGVIVESENPTLIKTTPTSTTTKVCTTDADCKTIGTVTYTTAEQAKNCCMRSQMAFMDGQTTSAEATSQNDANAMGAEFGYPTGYGTYSLTCIVDYPTYFSGDKYNSEIKVKTFPNKTIGYK